VNKPIASALSENNSRDFWHEIKRIKHNRSAVSGVIDGMVYVIVHPGEPVPEENFWTLWCKGRLTEADTQTIRLSATPSGLTSAHLHHPIFLQTGCPSCRPTNSVKALKATVVHGRS